MKALLIVTTMLMGVPQEPPQTMEALSQYCHQELMTIEGINDSLASLNIHTRLVAECVTGFQTSARVQP